MEERRRNPTRGASPVKITIANDASICEHRLAPSPCLLYSPCMTNLKKARISVLLFVAVGLLSSCGIAPQASEAREAWDRTRLNYNPVTTTTSPWCFLDKKNTQGGLDIPGCVQNPNYPTPEVRKAALLAEDALRDPADTTGCVQDWTRGTEVRKMLPTPSGVPYLMIWSFPIWDCPVTTMTPVVSTL